ncbi:Regulator [Sphingomonas sp. AX6]|nr:Regulator [Sphingomonas sp. AX6]
MDFNEDMLMSAQAAPNSNQRIPISLVDDDMIVRRKLQLLLHASDYDVRAYAHPDMLLADPASQISACLVSDLNMPAMDGFALLRRLRSGGWSGPAILITSSTDHDLAARAADEGFHAVLKKPLADRVVLAVVRDALAAR